ncbi:MAG: efflux RND transporter periplasmic adaptor subunit [Chitinophagaceae bacterium]
MKRIKQFKALFLAVFLLGTSCFLLPGCHSKKRLKGSNSQVYYTCVMHPQIHEDQPGNCPICGMELIKIERETKSKDSLNASLNYLEEPVTETAIGHFKVISPIRINSGDTITADGYTGFDESAINTIATRVAGRIDKLFIKYSNEPVHPGQALMRLYSPQLLTAQRNLLDAIKTKDTPIITPLKENLYHLGMLPKEVQQIIQSGQPQDEITIFSPYEGISQPIGSEGSNQESENPTGMKSADNNMTGNSSSKILQGSGKNGSNINGNSTQSQELLNIQEGMYVDAGQTVFAVQNIHRIWVILNLFSRDIARIHPGDAVELFAASEPSYLRSGRVNFIPAYRVNQEKTSQVRVYLRNLPENWKIGTLLQGKIVVQSTKMGWAIPLSAINRLGTSNIVWVQDKKHPGVFHARQVITAGQTGDNIRIISGLGPDDKIAENASYMVDSDSFIQ